MKMEYDERFINCGNCGCPMHSCGCGQKSIEVCFECGEEPPDCHCDDEEENEELDRFLVEQGS